MRFRSMHIYISVLASHGGISLTLSIVTKPTDSSNSYQNCLSSAVTIDIALRPPRHRLLCARLVVFEIFYILFRFVLLIASPFLPAYLFLFICCRPTSLRRLASSLHFALLRFTSLRTRPSRFDASSVSSRSPALLRRHFRFYRSPL